MKRPTPTILYLTWGEVPIQDGIYENQVIGQLIEIKRQEPETNISLLAGIPLVNRYTTIDREAHSAGINQIKDQLAESQIPFSTRWIWAVAKWFHSKRYHFPFYHFGQLQFLRQRIKQNQIDIIHCRGYHAAYVALRTKERYGLAVNIIFDTRGLFPEEGLLANHYQRSSKDYAKWKAVEQYVLTQSSAVVNVSKTFTEQIRTRTENRSLHTIHTSTELSLFYPASEQARQQIRSELQIAADEKVLIYVGSLSVDANWHRLSNLIDVYRTFRATFGPSKLFIVTRSDHAGIRAELENEELWGETILQAADSRQETGQLLRAADYGALAYYSVTDEIEQMVGHTVIASKTGEYLATGLPMLVNQSVGAAAQMVNEYQLGCTYKTGNEAAIETQLRAIDSDYEAVRQRCIATAQNYFSAATNAQRYTELYTALHQATQER